jgi:hypothetical protein
MDQSLVDKKNKRKDEKIGVFFLMNKGFVLVLIRAGQLSRKNELTQFNSLKKDFNSIQ